MIYNTIEEYLDKMTICPNATYIGFRGGKIPPVTVDICSAKLVTTGIRKVIFNDPATIVYWDDGTKTVVKCGKHDTFDKEKGLAMAFLKHIYGNRGNYNDIFRKWIKEDE